MGDGGLVCGMRLWEKHVSTYTLSSRYPAKPNALATANGRESKLSRVQRLGSELLQKEGGMT